MRLYIQQRIFTWGDRFSIYDEYGNEKYHVEGEVFTFGKKLHVFNNMNEEVVFIQQKLLSFLPKYYIYRNGAEIAEVVKEFTFFKHEYTVNGLGWQVHGDFFDHEFSITSGSRTIATVSKKWLSIGDSFEIEFGENVDIPLALAAVLVIDACIDAENNR